MKFPNSQLNFPKQYSKVSVNQRVMYLETVIGLHCLTMLLNNYTRIGLWFPCKSLPALFFLTFLSSKLKFSWFFLMFLRKYFHRYLYLEFWFSGRHWGGFSWCNNLVYAFCVGKMECIYFLSHRKTKALIKRWKLNVKNSKKVHF